MSKIHKMTPNTSNYIWLIWAMNLEQFEKTHFPRCLVIKSGPDWRITNLWKHVWFSNGLGVYKEQTAHE